MRKSLKTIPALLLAGIFLCVSCLPAQAQPLESAPPIQLTAPSYLLADAETGAIIFEKNADTPRQVASLTKLMTVLLVLERLDRGEISLDDTVAVSKTAASAPGSTALLDAGAAYRVEDLLRSAIVASGNDSATALAEHLAGIKDITVITNSLATVEALSELNVNVYVAGGRLNPENRSCFIGMHAEDTINSFHADYCFFSVQSITPDGVLYDCFANEIIPRRLMIKNSEKIIENIYGK